MPGTLGWDDDLAAVFAPFADTHLAARIARVDRSAVDLVRPGWGTTPRRATFRSQRLGPAVGDWVAVAERDSTNDAWEVEALLPRRTAIKRADPSGRSEAHVLAANVDVVLIAMPVVPEPKPAVVERMIALAWDSGAIPVVVVTKADITPESDAIAADLAVAAPGVDVVTVSAVADGGLSPMDPYLGEGRTLCLIGRSGAGKSSLVNALAGAGMLATAEIRSDGKGRHTTTHRELIVLPSGAVVIDTPGLRGAGLWASDEGLDRAFADVDELTAACRFSDCGHHSEPGCAVLAAVEDGRLPERRLESWRKLQREARWMATRNDARLRAEARREWVIIHKEVRRSGRIRP
jgi:ribosome biogenesis GTPase / thiamine phosphate phosphatase